MKKKKELMFKENSQTDNIILIPVMFIIKATYDLKN